MFIGKAQIELFKSYGMWLKFSMIDYLKSELGFKIKSLAMSH